MRSRKMLLTMATAVGALVFAGAASAYALQAGITVDIHQDNMLPVGQMPNDYHVEGLICSNNGTMPTVLQHIDDLFTPPAGTFSYSIAPAGLPDPCYFTFVADWRLTNGTEVPYCTVIHLGLLFDVDASNIVIDIHGWWTRNGVPVGRIFPWLRNGGYSPTLGFRVEDAGNQFVRIGNGFVVQPPPIPPPPPIEVSLTQLEVVPFPPGPPPPLGELREGGTQQFWPWVPVVNGAGVPISPINPMYMAPDSFFDVFLEMSIPGQPGLPPGQQFTIPPGGFLVVRQRMQFINNNNQVEERWQWEIHGAQPPEACCLEDGTCQYISPAECMLQGGNPRGAGTNCDDLNGNGQADVCEPPVPTGACCYGQAAPLCAVTDKTTCEQQLHGQYKGDGTNCNDADGNGIADVCEQVQETEACCMPNGTCQQVPPLICLQMNGQPMGPGSRCLGDADGDGKDDLCEAKWRQLPDLSTEGVDVKATQPMVLADDFLCTQQTRITDITIWGSWKNEMIPEPAQAGNVMFILSLYKDIPADPQGGIPYSRPGAMVWTRTFAPYTFAYAPYNTGDEGWWDPSTPGSFLPFGDRVCWKYDFRIPPAEAFCQRGSPDKPIVYWLGVRAVPAGATPAEFGWKTSIQHWNDDAVWGRGPFPYPGPWNELRYPAQHPKQGQSMDLAFLLDGDIPCCNKPPQDTDGDADVDLIDFAAFQNCFNGPNNPYGSGGSPQVCLCLDVDADGDVDLLDFAAFQSCFNGPNNPPACP